MIQYYLNVELCISSVGGIKHLFKYVCRETIKLLFGWFAVKEPTTKLDSSKTLAIYQLLKHFGNYFNFRLLTRILQLYDLTSISRTTILCTSKKKNKALQHSNQGLDLRFSNGLMLTPSGQVLLTFIKPSLHGISRGKKAQRLGSLLQNYATDKLKFHQRR